MIAKLTPRDLYEHLKRNIDIHWLAGSLSADKNIKRNLHLSDHATLIGHLNLIHPNRIQVIGLTEWNYLNKLRKNTRQDTLKQIFSRHTAAIIISDGIEVPELFIQLSDEQQIPLLSSQLSSSELIDAVRFYLASILAQKITMHGVFMEVMGCGVLITGESSIGKSELALELITRGHRLIADDATVFTHAGPGIIAGSCPEILKDFMEVRGLGLLNIRAMYGENAIKPSKVLRLIVQLKIVDAEEQKKIDRLYGNHSTQNILGVDITEVILPVATGRNLAVMVEAAVRHHILIENGHNPSEEFIRRQSSHIQENK